MSPRLGEVGLASQSDERLVKLARAGHERAFAVIVERYRPELSTFARRLSPDGKAEDIVQQAFLSAFAALRAGADVKHLRGWLYRIVRNAAARSQAPLCMPLDGATASDESVEDVVQQRDLAVNALAELARLPMRQRQAMVGTALDGRGRAEVATSMGVTEGAVRQLVHRARTRIRTAVTAVTPWPLVRWLAPARPGSGSAVNAAAGVGAASSSGAALKLGIVVASGAIATGVAAVDIHGGAGRSDPAGFRAGARVVHPQAARDDDQVLTVAVVTRVPVQADRSHGSHTAGTAAVVTPTVRVRRGGDGAVALPERQRGGGGDPSRSSDRVDGGSRLGGGGGPRPGGGAGSRPGGVGGSGLGRGAESGLGRGAGSGLGRGAGSGLGRGAGSGLGHGAGSAWGGGSARGLDGGSASGLGVGGWQVQDSAGSRHGRSGGQGPDGGSFLAPQAVMAGDGGSTHSGDRGGQHGSAGVGSGSGPTPGPGSGSASGTDPSSASRAGAGSASGSGSGPGPAPGTGSGFGSGTGAGPGSGPASGTDPSSASRAGAVSASGSGSGPGPAPGTGSGFGSGTGAGPGSGPGPAGAGSGPTNTGSSSAAGGSAR